MSDVSERFLRLLSELEELTDELDPAEAARTIDEFSLQLFWRQWPQVSSWAGALWRELNEDVADSASPASDGISEVGGSD